MNNLHLVCNAHIDVVWMWEIEEGVAETLSTFRTAADFCDDYDGFVFCHNEALLYQWVEEYDKDLFARIQRLVKEGKWHIMGGWFLQPDCNIPCGESFVRQIIEGRHYFKEKFDAYPTTAINFDAFGHTRGLVQIMAKSGYKSYLFCRPEPDMLDLPGEDFIWVGNDGSKIICHRAYNSYESHRGEADEKIKGWIEKNPDKKVGMVLWGIGNHGGGPSRIDYEKISKLNDSCEKYNIIHSKPESYFDELEKTGTVLNEYYGLLNPRYTGCYTTMSNVKQLHRRLENQLFLTEKMAAHAFMAGVMEYPGEKLREVEKDLMLTEFHDIIPGSAIEAVEKYSTNLCGHGLKILKDLQVRAFLALCSDKKRAKPGEIPVFVYNPNPFKVSETIEVEYMLPDQNKNRDLYALPVITTSGEKVISQREHEVSNFNVDWRIKSVFKADLNPGQMTRYDVEIKLIPTPKDIVQPLEREISFDNGMMKCKIDRETGLLTSYIVDGKEYLSSPALTPYVMHDDENSWAHKEREYRNIVGEFKLLSEKETAEFCAIKASDTLVNVRIIEKGDVRTIVEAIFGYGKSNIVRRYYLDNFKKSIRIEDRVFWNEKMKMLKLSIPTVVDGEYIGQQAYSKEYLRCNGEEMVSQKWVMAADRYNAFTIINDGTYGSDYLEGEIRLTLLRAPGYSAGKSDFSVRKPYIMEQDRYSDIIDQGKHVFNFVISAGTREERDANIERESTIVAESPIAMSFFPTGCSKEKEDTIKPFAIMEGDGLTLPVFKKARKDDSFIFRVFNQTDEERSATITFPCISQSCTCIAKPAELKTSKINIEEKTIKDCDLAELQ